MPNVIVNPNLAGQPLRQPARWRASASRSTSWRRLRRRLDAAQQLSPRARRRSPEFLDLVALGTVADVVPLDSNNRVLVSQGLKRIRAGRCVAGHPRAARQSPRRRRA